MRKILKSQPPTNVAAQPPSRSWNEARAELLAEIKTAPAEGAQVARMRFDAIDKLPVRRALGKEQNNLCVFCETRIDPELGFAGDGSTLPVTAHKDEAVLGGVRIAHWKPIRVDPRGAFDWRNVYASCSGAWPSGARTCDPHQGEMDPHLEPPAERDWGVLLEFGSDGHVRPRDGANADLKSAVPNPPAPGIWNLNHLSLVTARKAAIDAELERARAERDRRGISKRDVIDEALRRLDKTPLRSFITALRQAFARWRQ